MTTYTNTTMVADTTDVDGFMGENVSASFTEAMEDFKYDMSGYTSRIEAEDMINIHIYKMQQIENILLKISYSDFLKS